MIFRKLLFRITLALVPLFSAIQAEAREPVPEPIGVISALKWCDSAPLEPAEGIWEYPGEGISVLVAAESGRESARLVMRVIDSEDCRLSPGDILGYLERTPDPNRFRLIQYRKRHRGVLTSPGSCSATLGSGEDRILISQGKWKISFNPLSLLPRFWRLLKVKVSNGEELPVGLVKRYPSYDGNGSSRSKPRYL